MAKPKLVTEYRCVLNKDRILRVSDNVDDAHLAAAVIRASIGDSPVERMIVLGISAVNDVIGTAIVAQGSVHNCAFTVADVVRPVLLMGAGAFIIGHNHPSSSPALSPHDVALTRKIRKAADILGIYLVDHIIIAERTHASMRTLGMLSDTLDAAAE